MRIIEGFTDLKVRRLMQTKHITQGQIEYLCALPYIQTRASELDMCISDGRNSIVPCVQTALEGLNLAERLAVIKARDQGLFKNNG